jgi:hypothetical protein
MLFFFLFHSFSLSFFLVQTVYQLELVSAGAPGREKIYHKGLSILESGLFPIVLFARSLSNCELLLLFVCRMFQMYNLWMAIDVDFIQGIVPIVADFDDMARF